MSKQKATSRLLRCNHKSQCFHPYFLTKIFAHYFLLLEYLFFSKVIRVAPFIFEIFQNFKQQKKSAFLDGKIILRVTQPLQGTDFLSASPFKLFQFYGSFPFQWLLWLMLKCRKGFGMCIGNFPNFVRSQLQIRIYLILSVSPALDLIPEKQSYEENAPKFQ